MARPKIVYEYGADGFMLATGFKNGLIAHHPSCYELTKSTYVKTQLVMVLPDDIRKCQRCKCMSPQERKQLKNAKRATRRRQYQVTIQHVEMHRHSQKWHWIITVVKCPKCGSDNLDRDGRSWLCWDCDWLGAVKRSEIIEQWRRLNAQEFQAREADEAAHRCGPVEHEDRSSGTVEP